MILIVEFSLGSRKMMFSHLKSRWTMPLWCRYMSAFSRLRASSTASTSWNGPLEDRRVYRSSPVALSMTMWCMGDARKISLKRIMLGWDSVHTMEISFSSCEGSSRAVSSMILTAQGSDVSLCWHSCTVEKEPVPISLPRVYIDSKFVSACTVMADKDDSRLFLARCSAMEASALVSNTCVTHAFFRTESGRSILGVGEGREDTLFLIQG
mmetsp:Transcript_9768/g.24402  ORF Transcript_9768/g.24402 Transcript_9768/m.24402 type:complete len:210 (+) Transcript_9768:665-1294(+)